MKGKIKLDDGLMDWNGWVGVAGRIPIWGLMPEGRILIGVAAIVDGDKEFSGAHINLYYVLFSFPFLDLSCRNSLVKKNLVMSYFYPQYVV